MLAEPEPELPENPNGWEQYEHITYLSYDSDNRLRRVERDDDRGVNRYPTSVDTLEYADFVHPSNATATDQVFRAVQTVTRKENTSAVIAPVGSATLSEKRSTIDTFNLEGLLGTSVLSWLANPTVLAAAGSRTTTYTYWKDAASADRNPSLTGPSLNASNQLSGTTSTPTFQYGDLVRTKVVEGGSGITLHPTSVNRQEVSYVYDLMGNVARETHARVGDSINTSAQPALTTTHVTDTAHDGWGNKIWERVTQNGRVDKVQGWMYHPTGELANEWLGSPENLKTYTYNTLGQLTSTRHGLGSAAWTLTSAISTERQRTDFTYDSFGRLLEERAFKQTGTDHFTAQHSYDTLDRLVSKVLPESAGTIRTFYDVHGEASRAEEPFVTRTSTRDRMGYLTQETVTPTVDRGVGYTLTYVNDEYGRPLTITNSDQSICGNTGCTTTYIYDEDGNRLSEVGPPLRTAATRGFTDGRRTSLVTRYDNLGRKIREIRALNTAVTASAPLPSSLATDAAETVYSYDNLDNLIRVQDPEGYLTETAYDGLGQTTMSRRQVWRSASGLSSADLTKLGLNATTYTSTWATTHSAYNGNGEVTEQRDPAGFTSSKRFNLLGLPVAELGQFGNPASPSTRVTRGYTYTPEGLLLSTWEPRMDVTNTDVVTPFLNNAPDTSRFQITQTNHYGRSHQPVRVDKWVNTSTLASTNYTYNWQGKPTLTRLPDGVEVTAAYDYQGNVTREVDADSFVTETRHDYTGKPLEQFQPVRRTTNTSNQIIVGPTDSAAGFPALTSGLRSLFTYDAFGNLTQKSERGLVTRYQYNILGKVIAESKPSVNPDSTTPAVPYKRFAYRLDGALLVETNYSFSDGGTLATSMAASGGPTVSSSPTTITAGNLRVYRHDKLGRITEEASYGRFTASGSSSAAQHQERYSSQVYNGLGQRVKRDFNGHRDLYANLRNPTTGGFLNAGNVERMGPYPDNQGSDPVRAYQSYWTYDLRSKLLSKWDEINGTRFNEFSYTYSPTGKETRTQRTVVLRLSRSVATNANTSIPAGTNPIVAATTGRTESTYNQRDLLLQTSVFDGSVSGVATVEAIPGTAQRVTNYTYYLDGSRHQEQVSGVGTRTYTYDVRGRKATETDPTGTNVPLFKDGTDPERDSRYLTMQGTDGMFLVSPIVGRGIATTTYTYGAGTSTEAVSWAGDGSGACSVSTTRVFTVGGLLHRETTTNTCDPNQASTTRTVVYGERGLATSDNTLVTGTYAATRASATANPARPRQRVNNQSTVITYNDDNTLGERIVRATITREGFTFSGGSVLNSENINETRHLNEYTDDGYVRREVKEQRMVSDRSDNAIVVPTSGTQTHLVKQVDSQERTRTEYMERKTNGAGSTSTSEDATYSLDSRGNRWAIASTAYYNSCTPDANNLCNSWTRTLQVVGKHNGYVKRMDADDKVAAFYRFNVGVQQGSFTDFVYDPQGNQVLSSSAAYRHDSSGHFIRRDFNSVHYSSGEVQAIRKRFGENAQYPGGYILWWERPPGITNTFDTANAPHNHWRDQTFTMADGLADANQWGAVVLYNANLPGDGATVFEAPQTPKTEVLKQAPLQVKPANQTEVPSSGSSPTNVTPPTPRVPDAGGQPSAPTAPATVQQQATTPTAQGQTAGTIQPLTSVQVQSVPSSQPAPTASSATPAPVTPQPQPAAKPAEAGKDASSIQFQAPQASPLPLSVQAVSPQEVAIPNQPVGQSPVTTTSPSPTTVTAPNKAQIPSTSANPQDGPLTTVAPSSIAVPNVPPVAPNNAPQDVAPPPGFKPNSGGNATASVNSYCMTAQECGTTTVPDPYLTVTSPGNNGGGDNPSSPDSNPDDDQNGNSDGQNAQLGNLAPAPVIDFNQVKEDAVNFLIDNGVEKGTATTIVNKIADGTEGLPDYVRIGYFDSLVDLAVNEDGTKGLQDDDLARAAGMIADSVEDARDSANRLGNTSPEAFSEYFLSALNGRLEASGANAKSDGSWTGAVGGPLVIIGTRVAQAGATMAARYMAMHGAIQAARAAGLIVSFYNTKGTVGKGFNFHHLLEKRAFEKIGRFSYDWSLTIRWASGNQSPHQRFHAYMDEMFWSKLDDAPTVAQYLQAMDRAIRFAGHGNVFTEKQMSAMSAIARIDLQRFNIPMTQRLNQANLMPQFREHQNAREAARLWDLANP